MKLLIVTVLFLLAAVPASACGDGAVAQNLRLTAGVRAGLADAYRATHWQAPARPLAGHTWYGRFGGGPVGLSTLAVALGEEPDTIEDVYEPYLLQLGFLQRTPRGRVVTELGRVHVGTAPADDSLF